MVAPATLMKNTHTGIVPVVRVVLLLWISSFLGAQSQGVGPMAHQAACQSQAKTDKDTNQTSCIVDLKPGDVRLFAPSRSSVGRLYRWLDLQAASLGTQYVFVKSGLGVTTANQQQYQVAVRGRFKLDAKGRFGINAGLYTGANFVAGFNNTGLGMAKRRATYILSTYI